jgi:multicomponent Na+:H+ antiporter subunit E
MRIVAMRGRALVVRALLLAAGWWILVEGDAGALVFGVPMVLAALLASLSLPSSGSPRWHPLGLLRFARVFVVGSLHGGFDVARRALAPRVRIEPAIVDYRLRLPEGPARNLFLGAMSLMPGSLSLDVRGARLEIHVLAARKELVGELETLEASIARATGEQLLEGSRA